MSKCISSHGEYSDHEPGDPCPYCGEYDMDRIIAERDQAEARIQGVRELHSTALGHTPTCAACGHPCPCPTIHALDGDA